MKYSHLIIAASCACLAPLSLHAQKAPATPVPPDDDIVTLSPFEVNAGKTTGYMAAEGATGTRYAAPIMEVPISVQAITSEFIEDFFLLDLNDVTTYASGFVINGNEGSSTFNVRGIRSNGVGTYRNGMKSDGIYGPVAVDRVEIVRGPNAAIYGATEPAGLRNIITKNPALKPFASLRLSGGTDDFYRVALDVNQPIVQRTLLTRFAASVEESKQYVADFAHFRRKNLYNSTTWKIGPNTAVTWHLDYVQFRNQAQGANLPLVQALVELPDGAGGTVNTTATVGRFGTGLWERFQNMNTSGRGANHEMEFTQLDASFTHQFSKWLSLRVLAGRIQRNQDIMRTSVGTPANRNIYDRWTYDTATQDYVIPLLTMTSPRGSYVYYLTDTAVSGAGSYLGGTLGGVYTPRIERNRLTQANVQADLLAQFRTGSVSHKLLLTADYSIQDSRSRQRLSVERDPADTANGRNDPADPSTWTHWGGLVTLNDSFWGDWGFTNPDFAYTFDFFNADKWNYDTLWTDDQQVTKGIMVSERAAFFGNRLIAFAGVRHDEINTTIIDHLNATNNVGDSMVDHAPGGMRRYAPDRAVTMQSGILYKLTPELSAYVNYSQSFNPNRSDGANRDINRNPLSASRGEGYEIGLKAALFGEKLNFTLTYFDTDKKKVPRVARDELGQAIYIPGSTDQYSNLNDINTRGVELDLNARATPSLSILFAAGYTDVSYTYVQNATEQYLLKVPPDGTPKWMGSLALTYNIRQGMLKGMNFRLGVRYTGPMLMSNSSYSLFGNSKYNAPVLSIGNRTYQQYYFENPALTLVEGGASYTWNTGRVRNSVGLNIKNLLNQVYLRGSRPGDPMSLILSYDISFK
ncbi:MAG: TonB-dependent receptor [Opitutaceae bacterium]|jgi:outer membrane receptor protein involved in Fe transport|nr:TonB-dependent receptor [Opitutaceae bacterium]